MDPTAVVEAIERFNEKILRHLAPIKQELKKLNEKISQLEDRIDGQDVQSNCSNCSNHTIRSQDSQQSQISCHSRNREATPEPEEMEEDFQEPVKTGIKGRATPNFEVNTENRFSSLSEEDVEPETNDEGEESRPKKTRKQKKKSQRNIQTPEGDILNTPSKNQEKRTDFFPVFSQASQEFPPLPVQTVTWAKPQPSQATVSQSSTQEATTTATAPQTSTKAAIVPPMPKSLDNCQLQKNPVHEGEMCK